MKLYNLIPILLIIGIVLISGCAQPTQTTTTTTQPVPAPGVEPEEVEETVVVEEPAEVEAPAEPAAPVSEVKEFAITAKQFDFTPSTITVKEGDEVRFVITTLDSGIGSGHGFSLAAFGVNERLQPGKTTTVEFTADKKGTFSFFCSVVCGSGHGGMNGKLVVE